MLHNLGLYLLVGKRTSYIIWKIFVSIARLERMMTLVRGYQAACSTGGAIQLLARRALWSYICSPFVMG